MYVVPWFIPQRNQIRDIKLLSCSDLFNSYVMNFKKQKNRVFVLHQMLKK